MATPPPPLQPPPPQAMSLTGTFYRDDRHKVTVYWYSFYLVRYFLRSYKWANELIYKCNICMVLAGKEIAREPSELGSHRTVSENYVGSHDIGFFKSVYIMTTFDILITNKSWMGKKNLVREHPFNLKVCVCGGRGVCMGRKQYSESTYIQDVAKLSWRRPYDLYMF